MLPHDMGSSTTGNQFWSVIFSSRFAIQE